MIVFVVHSSYLSLSYCVGFNSSWTRTLPPNPTVYTVFESFLEVITVLYTYFIFYIKSKVSLFCSFLCFSMQKEAWSEQVVREGTLAVGGGKDGSARKARHLERKQDLHALVDSYHRLQPKEYLLRVVSVMAKEL